MLVRKYGETSPQNTVSVASFTRHVGRHRRAVSLFTGTSSSLSLGGLCTGPKQQYLTYLSVRNRLDCNAPYRLATPHAWTFCDLDFSLSECWNVAWKPPFFGSALMFGLPTSKASTPRTLMPPPPRLLLPASLLRL